MEPSTLVLIVLAALFGLNWLSSGSDAAGAVVGTDSPDAGSAAPGTSSSATATAARAGRSAGLLALPARPGAAPHAFNPNVAGPVIAPATSLATAGPAFSYPSAAPSPASGGGVSLTPIFESPAVVTTGQFTTEPVAGPVFTLPDSPIVFAPVLASDTAIPDTSQPAQLDATPVDVQDSRYV